LAEKVLEFFFDDKVFAEKCEMFNEMTDEYSRFFGVARDPINPNGFIRWIMYSVPSKNTVAFSVLPRWVDANPVANGGNNEMYFFKIIIEKGVPSEKVEDKILEIEQALVNLNFAKDPCYKDKRELKNSPFKYAIRKLPFLRILRKSFSGKASAPDVKEWQKQAKEIMEKSII
jgi:hypothetical protein